MMTGSIAVPLLHCLLNPKRQRPNQSRNGTHDPTRDVAYHELFLTPVPKIVRLLPKSMALRRRRRMSKTTLLASLGN
jgi:hypothetical protein